MPFYIKNNNDLNWNKYSNVAAVIFACYNAMQTFEMNFQYILIVLKTHLIK
jgi:hypothetical protein